MSMGLSPNKETLAPKFQVNFAGWQCFMRIVTYCCGEKLVLSAVP